LRAQGRLAEFGPADLAMTVGEASELLRGNGVEPTAAQAEELARRTEGWPAGLYIAALTIRAGNPAAGFSFTGDDRLMRDYLRSELLPRITPAQAGFLALTSVLDRMCGPLCDAVIGGRRSAHILEELVQHNLLVVPLDRRGEWYRYHHLLRDLLLSELRRDAPELVPTLHVRAAAWYQANGMAESALEHAMAAGDTDRMARLVLEVMQPVWASGRIDTVRRWMEWLSAKPATREHAAIATHGALIFALLGRPSEAERWAAVAERLPRAGKLPDGSTVDATVAYLRANLAREGIAAMRSDSLMAFEGLSPNSPYRATMLFTEGVSHLLDGDLERADAVLAHSYDMSKAAGALPLTALALAERHLVAAERDDLASAGQYVREAVEIVDGGGFDSYWTSALVLASAARHAALQGHVAAARRHAQGAARLRPLLTYALPVVSVQALLEMARVYIALVDPEGARAVLAQTRDILQQRPRLGPLPAAATRLQSDVGQLTRTAAGGSSLTEAELRLVPLLPTHLSFPEIGERLFISRHTVKTHAISLYRKLGVSSRSEAVARMSELGMHSG
jgi:LuxR family maltose regulon positive regulatory protein